MSESSAAFNTMQDRVFFGAIREHWREQFIMCAPIRRVDVIVALFAIHLSASLFNCRLMFKIKLNELMNK